MFVIDTMERVWREGGVGGLGPSLEYGAGCAAAGHSVLSPPPYHHITPSGTLGPLPRSHQDLGDNVQIWQYHLTTIWQIWLFVDHTVFCCSLVSCS